MTMPRDLAGDVDTYIGHFRREHAKLMALTDDLHKRILAVTMLSALAEGCYARERNSGAQFARFLETFCEWTDAVCISLTSLEMAEEATPRLTSGTLEAIAKRAQAWRARTPRALDPKLEDILPDAEGADRERVEQFKHSALLWVYRNKLVHEYRKPGHGMDSPTADAPFYHGRTCLDDGTQTVELAYPVSWLVGLVPQALDRLERHYLESGTNPYHSYEFGSPWRR
jgi:hypothetical protein